MLACDLIQCRSPAMKQLKILFVLISLWSISAAADVARPGDVTSIWALAIPRAKWPGKSMKKANSITFSLNPA